RLSVPARRDRWSEDAPSVNEDPVVLADRSQRAQHRDMTRVIDVEAVDLGERSRADAHLHDSAADRIEKAFALKTREDFRIVHLADEARVRRHETRGRDDATSERRHADFSDA